MFSCSDATARECSPRSSYSGCCSAPGDPQAISAFTGFGKVEVQRTIADELKFLDRSILLLVAVSSTSTNHGSSWRDAHGQIEVQLPGAPLNNPYGPNYGDSVELQGKVQAPFSQHSPEVLASMTFPLLSVTGSGGNPLLAALFQLRIALATIITPSLPQPVATLLIAILLSLHTVRCNVPSESMRWCIGVMSDQGLMRSQWEGHYTPHPDFPRLSSAASSKPIK